MFEITANALRSHGLDAAGVARALAIAQFEKLGRADDVARLTT